MKTYSATIIMAIMAVTSVRAHLTYLHDGQSAAVATNLQSEAQAYAKEFSDIYAAMQENVNRFATQEEGLITQFAQNYQDALVTGLPSATYDSLRERQVRLRASTVVFNDLISTNIQTYLAEQKLAQADSKSIADNITQIGKQIDAANAEIDSWNQMTALYYQAFQHLSGASTNSMANAIHSVQDAVNAANKIKDVKLIYVGADGSQKTNTIDQAAISLVHDTISGTHPAPPGITLDILGLALDLAKIKKQQVQNRSAQLEVRAGIYREALAYKIVAERLLKESSSELSPIMTGDGNARFVADAWRVRQESLSATNSTKKLLEDDALSAMLLSLRQMAVAEFLLRYEQQHFVLAVARAKHQESIIVSEQNDQMYRQAVVRSSVALADYYKGGFTEQDLSTVIQFAQSVALFIIASNIR